MYDSGADPDEATPANRITKLEDTVRRRTHILELIRKWHLGSLLDAPNAASFSSSTSSTRTATTPTTTTTCKLSDLFFGVLYISRDQLCRFFSETQPRVALVRRMFQQGFGIGALLSDAALCSSSAADFSFCLHELLLEIAVDDTAHNLLPSRSLSCRALRKDREERFGSDSAVLAVRPVPRYVDATTAVTQPTAAAAAGAAASNSENQHQNSDSNSNTTTRACRWGSDSFMFHEAHHPEVENLVLCDNNSSSSNLDYFSVTLGFVQTLLLCYRRMLDSALVRNALAWRRFKAWDAEMEENVLTPLWGELKRLVDAMLGQADVELVAALAGA